MTVSSHKISSENVNVEIEKVGHPCNTYYYYELILIRQNQLHLVRNMRVKDLVTIQVHWPSLHSLYREVATSCAGRFNAYTKSKINSYKNRLC